MGELLNALSEAQDTVRRAIRVARATKGPPMTDLLHRLVGMDEQLTLARRRLIALATGMARPS